MQGSIQASTTTDRPCVCKISAGISPDLLNYLSSAEIASDIQEVSVVVSPRGGGGGAPGGGGPEVPLTRGLGHLRTQSMRSLDSPMHPRRVGSLPDIGTPGTSTSNQARSQDRTSHPLNPFIWAAHSQGLVCASKSDSLPAEGYLIPPTTFG